MHTHYRRNSVHCLNLLTIQKANLKQHLYPQHQIEVSGNSLSQHEREVSWQKRHATEKIIIERLVYARTEKERKIVELGDALPRQR